MIPAEITALLLLILLLLLISILFVSWKLSSLIVKPAVISPRLCYEDEIAKEKIRRSDYETDWKREDFTFTTTRGYRLSCTFIPSVAPAAGQGILERVIILVHGYTSCKYGSMKYVDIFRSLGFSCLLYDHRNHGDSDKVPTTMGYYESYDLEELCGWVRKRFPDGVMIGTHGESMGAATVMMHTKLSSGLSFAIEDCGYSSLTDQLVHNMKQLYHLPKFPFFYVASLLSKLRGGVFFGQVEPKDALASAKNIPMLFLHGESDTFVPFAMVQEAYNSKPGEKSLCTYPNAGHAESYWTWQQQYTRDVTQFLLKNNLL